MIFELNTTEISVRHSISIKSSYMGYLFGARVAVLSEVMLTNFQL